MPNTLLILGLLQNLDWGKLTGLSSDFLHILYSIGRTNVGAAWKAGAAASMGIFPISKELEAGRPPVSLAPLAGSKPQTEDQGEIDEGGHLYDFIKMLYEENFCPEQVKTKGMEDAIALVKIHAPFLP